ncbi:prepilin peptidase [Cohnella sp.]|uniref:A24 family peptidase n=1 Tax=Cohnella sp. TaxID=1883426 RepID=UPI0035612B26
MNIEVLVIVSLFLITACWTDIQRMKIPNALTVFFASGGILYQLILHDMSGLRWALLGAVVGFVPLYIMHRLGGIGGGDVKWFGAFGIWMGPLPTLQLLVFSILFAGGIAGVLLILRLPGLRKWGKRLKWPWGPHPVTIGRSAQIPFMIAVAPGFITLLGKG